MDDNVQDVSDVIELVPTVDIPYRGFLLKRGSRGEDVRTWQRQMVTRGWDLAVDGVYGPVTEGVCRAFQLGSADKNWLLEIDGVVGKQTWDAAWLCPR